MPAKEENKTQNPISSDDNDSLPTSNSSLNSLSTNSSNIYRPKSVQNDGDLATVPLTTSLTNRILTRTATIVEGIKDDNQYAADQESIKIPPAPFGATDPEDAAISRQLSRKLTAERAGKLENYNGEFNKQDIIDRPPDGTFWGWLSAVCVCFINTFSWGTNSSFGVFLNYYVKTNHFPGATMEDYAIIGGLNLGLSYMLCNIANSLVRRFYYKSVMAVGIVLIVICYLCAAEAKTIVQLIMLQGFLLSIAYALAAGPGFVIIPTWFLKRRSIATGIGTSGAGLAGVIFSRPTQALIDKTGSYKWALRMIGIVCGVMLAISTLLIRCRRNLIVHTTRPFWKELLRNFTRWDIYFKRPIFCLVIWNLLYGIGYAILLFTMSSYATAIGLTYQQGSIVTTVQSVAQLIGRPLMGFVSDYFGKANVTLLITAVLGLLCLVYWIFIKSYAALIVFAFISGIMVGINWVNFTPLAADVVGGGDDLLAAVSVLCFWGGAPMVVAEIVGLKLERPNESKPFLYCQLLVGCAIILSALFLLPFREWKVRRILTARKALILKKSEEKRDPGDETRLKRYELVLGNNIHGFLIRMLYPIKV